MFIKDCNTCWCNEDGTSYYCTRRVCVPLLPEDQPDIGGIPAEVGFLQDISITNGDGQSRIILKAN